MIVHETVTLYNTSPGHNKFYTISIIEEGGVFSVPFTYGPLNSWTKSGSKYSGPLLSVATAKYTKKTNEQLAKGYYTGASLNAPTGASSSTPAVTSAPATSSASSIQPAVSSNGRPAGIAQFHCQLLTEIEQSEVIPLVIDDNIVAQEKHDGRRRQLIYFGCNGKIYGQNKKGSLCNYPKVFDADLTNMANHSGIHSFCLDGEEVGDTFYAFDILSYDHDVRDKSYKERLEILSSLLGSVPTLKNIKLVETAVTLEEKKALLEKLIKGNAEGVVFKRYYAPYIAGRGMDALKFKFYATASFLVAQVNAKRSVAIAVYDGGKLVRVGNCTIPPNKDIPAQDAIIEVKYLYAHKGGSVYQPIYLGERDDVTADECLQSQLKYKAAA